MKTIFSKLLVMCICIGSISTEAFGTQLALTNEMSTNKEITEEEVLKEIAEGTSKVTNKVVDIPSVTEEMIMEDVGLRNHMEKLAHVVPYAANSASNTGSIHTTTVESASGDIIKYYSTPTINITVDDFGKTGASNYTVSISCIASTTVNGQEENDWNPYILYKNNKVSLGCGENSVFTSLVRVSGTHKESGGIVKDIIGILASIYEFDTVGSILDAFLSVVDYRSTTVGSNGGQVAIAKGNVRAVSAEFDGVLSEDGDVANVSTSFSAKENLEYEFETVAAAQWTYDIYYGVGAPRPSDSDSLEVDVNYLYLP